MVVRTLARTAKQESFHDEPQSSTTTHATKQAHGAETSVKEKSSRMHELVFEPWEEVRAPLNEVHKSMERNGSTARVHWFAQEAEDAINAQINVELTIAHVYESMCVVLHAHWDTASHVV